MEQKSKIDSIKKCKLDLRTLSPKETDDALRVEANNCSTFLSSIGLLAQGEGNNQRSKSRNAVITFRNPATAKVKSKDFGFNAMFVSVFLVFACGVTY